MPAHPAMLLPTRPGLALLLAVGLGAGWGLAPGCSRPASKAPPPPPPPGVVMRTVPFHGATYDVVEVDLEQAALHLYWKDEKGARLANLGRLRDWLAKRKRPLVAGMNAGIFEAGGVPAGLHVEHGLTMRPLNVRAGAGNFYLKPNGVFLIGAAGAAVVEAAEVPALATGLEEATQSGPLLVRAGKVHPQLSASSPSRYVRNGVGVAGPKKVVLAISHEEVNLHDFALLFRDALGCPDALYLDGYVSKLYAPSLGREDVGGDFGALLAVEPPAPEL